MSLKKRWLLGAIAGFSHLVWAGSAAGTWQTFDEDTGEKAAQINIIQLGSGELVGRIVKLHKNPDAVCTECSGGKKGKPIQGMTILWGLKPDGDNEWSGGDILDPENGETYSLNAELSADGKSLEVRGYLGISALGRTQTWQRIK